MQLVILGVSSLLVSMGIIQFSLWSKKNTALNESWDIAERDRINK